MKLIATGTFILLLSAMGFAQTASYKIEDLGFIAGCWQSETVENSPVFSEFWIKAGGGSMLGIGRAVQNGKTVDYEYLRIVQDEKGIFYIAKPKANVEETPFKLTKLAGMEAIFENPAHDFPQKIIYRVDGTKLFARIEGNNKGKPIRFDFPMNRVKCE